jgi:hypothetical protein
MNILILTYIYAPDQSPRAFRWTALSEYWARQGHEITVVAARKGDDPASEERNGVAIRRVGGLTETLRGLVGKPSHRSDPPHGDPVMAAKMPGIGAKNLWKPVAQRVYAASLRPLFWPDYAWDWYWPALRAAKALCRDRRFDAIITVSHPFTPHLAGLALKRPHPGLCWLADIGDPFSFFDEIPLNNLRLYRGLNRRIEQRVLAAADAAAVTVERCRIAYQEAFPESRDKIAVIPPLLSLPLARSAAPRLLAPEAGHLVFIGTLYPGLRAPDFLLALFAAIGERLTGWQLHFFGDTNHCEAAFAPYRDLLGTSLHLHGKVSRETVQKAMIEADILVNIGNSTAHQLPSKLVEYAAMHKPILNLASAEEDTARDFLAGYGAALSLRRALPVPEATLAAALAFLADPPHIEGAQAEAFLQPYQIERIAAEYLALLMRQPKAPTTPVKG